MSENYLISQNFKRLLFFIEITQNVLKTFQHVAYHFKAQDLCSKNLHTMYVSLARQVISRTQGVSHFPQYYISSSGTLDFAAISLCSV